MDFLIIASGLNCDRHITKCYESLAGQTYQNFKAVLISDGSTDNSAVILNRLANKDTRINTICFAQNCGAAKRRFDAIKEFSKSKQTIIVLVGLDDYLLPNALETIKCEYEKGVYMTYGNWKNQRGIGLPADFDLFFDEETHKHREYRKVKYRSTAPNTFKKFLFDEIPESDFKLNGKWFDTTTESELMFSCLEMSGKDRIGVILEYIYVYNQNLPNGTLNRLGANYKAKVYSEVIKRPKKKLFTFTE